MFGYASYNIVNFRFRIINLNLSLLIFNISHQPIIKCINEDFAQACFDIICLCEAIVLSILNFTVHVQFKIAYYHYFKYVFES